MRCEESEGAMGTSGVGTSDLKSLFARKRGSLVPVRGVAVSRRSHRGSPDFTTWGELFESPVDGGDLMVRMARSRGRWIRS